MRKKRRTAENFYRGPERGLLFQENKVIYLKVSGLTPKIAKEFRTWQRIKKIVRQK